MVIYDPPLLPPLTHSPFATFKIVSQDPLALQSIAQLLADFLDQGSLLISDDYLLTSFTH